MNEGNGEQGPGVATEDDIKYCENKKHHTQARDKASEQGREEEAAFQAKNCWISLKCLLR